VSNFVTVAGHADLNPNRTFTGQQSNNATAVSVQSTEVPTTATVTKNFVGTEAGCATVRYSVDVKNTSALDESATLSALSDSPYGDLTKCTNSNCANNSGGNGSLQILGTTCGVASGIGTLSGSAGAGALPTTLAVNATYSCQFDGQFCSALDNNHCIKNADTASATLTGDEAGDKAFTQGGNTITVTECFTATVSSTGP